ncbi:protein O-mannosyl-transferase TMTC4-like [Dysidea avara]|uniref:protein O-mannosyl-transferase TMTC4-like n=1 Tax=Dysidea avara TaxID=196820 RepID=UPI00332CB053
MIHALLTLAGSLLVYVNSLNGGFAFDDHRAILENPDLRPEERSLWQLLNNDFWGGSMTREVSHKSYRPLTVLSYRYLNYAISELHPFSYHLVNVLLHGVACVLFLFLCRIILGRGTWSLFSALLFAVHGVHTEAVANVVGRAELLCCIFFLLAIVSYHFAINKGSSHLTRWPLVTLSILLSALAMFSKEQGITSIGVCLVLDVLVCWDLVWSKLHLWLRGKDGITDDVSFRHHIHRIGTLLFAGAALTYFRLSLNYGTQPIFKPREMRAAFHEDILVRMFSFSNIYTFNAWLLLNPYYLCCDWSLGSIPLVYQWNDIRNVASLSLYLTFVLLAGLVLKARNSEERLQVGISFGMLIVPFIPSAGIIFRVGFVVAERVLYLPSLGFCLIVAIGFQRLHSILPKILQKVLYACMMFILLIMAARTMRRNQDWYSDITLYKSGILLNPRNVKMHNNYGLELKSSGRVREAEQHYMKAIELEENYHDVYFNYGNLLSDEGKIHEAAVKFEKAMESPQLYAKTLNNLATMYYRMGQFHKAEDLFKESMVLIPDQASTYNNLASLYGQLQRFDEAQEMFHKAIAMSPTYTEAYFNLGTLLYQMGKVEEAEKYLRHALQLNPHHSGAINNLKVVEYHKKKTKKRKRT